GAAARAHRGQERPRRRAGRRHRRRLRHQPPRRGPALAGRHAGTRRRDPTGGETVTPILQGRGLVKSYGPTRALRGVTLTVAEGEILAVTGPSGCGKSTLLHCLAGILRPDAGEVVYRDHRIDTWSQARRTQLRRAA